MGGTVGARATGPLSPHLSLGGSRWSRESRPGRLQRATLRLGPYLTSHVTPGKSWNLLFWKSRIIIPTQFTFHGFLGGTAERVLERTQKCYSRIASKCLCLRPGLGAVCATLWPAGLAGQVTPPCTEAPCTEASLRPLPATLDVVTETPESTAKL